MSTAYLAEQHAKEVLDAQLDLYSLATSASSLCHARSIGVALEDLGKLTERSRLFLAKMEHPSSAYSEAKEAADPGQVLDMVRSALNGDSENMKEAARSLRAFASRVCPILD